MKKITKCAISTLTAALTIVGGIKETTAAISVRDIWAYRAKDFVIDGIFPNRDEITVHYYGTGDDELKTNYLNVYWSDFSIISESAMDEMMGGVGIATPDQANLLVNKKTELSPNTKSPWRLWRFENTGDKKMTEIPGVLYYSVRLANGSFLTGKADYRDCISNPLYIEAGEEAYCKLEQYEEGGDLYYWPYKESFGRLGSEDEPAKPGIGAGMGIEGLEGDIDDIDDGHSEDGESSDKDEDSTSVSTDEGKSEDKNENMNEDNDGVDHKEIKDEDKEDSKKPVNNSNIKVVIPVTPNTGFEPKI